MYELTNAKGNIVRIKAASIKQLAKKIEGKWYNHIAYRITPTKKTLIYLPKIKL